MEYLNDKGDVVSDNYYEGVLQLRNPTQELIHFVRELVHKRGRVFIAKEEKVNNGIDMYLSSQKFLQIIGKQLLNKFKGEMMITRRLHTVKRITSKFVWRVTVLFRLPKFKVGDVVRAGRREIRVKNMGKKVFGVDIETGKKVSVNYGDIQS